MTLGLLQHLGGFLKHFSPISTQKNEKTDISSESAALEAKFVAFLKEKKLQEISTDPDLEFKKELLSWVQKEKLLNNLALWSIEPLFSNINIFWPYFAKLIQNLNHNDGSNVSVKNLRKALAKEENFYTEIFKIINKPKMTGTWKTQQLQLYIDKGLLLNPSIGIYHPTAKSVPFFSTMMLFLKISPNMATQTTINNVEDLKIIFDFYRQEQNPSINDFDLFQEPKAYFDKFIKEIPLELEKSGIIKLYHKHIDSINLEVSEVQSKRELKKQQIIQQETLLKNLLTKNLSEQKKLSYEHQEVLKKNFTEFSSSLLQLKSEEIKENQSIERKNIIDQSDDEFFGFNMNHLLQLKTTQSGNFLNTLVKIQKNLKSLYEAPFVIQNVQEPTSRQKIIQERLTEIKTLKLHEEQETKSIEKTISSKRKISRLFEMFSRKAVYLPQDNLPPQILESFDRKNIFSQQEREFYDLLKTKNQTEIFTLKKQQAEKRKAIENNALKLHEDPSIKAYLLTTILQTSKREDILEEENFAFSKMQIENNRKYQTAFYKEKIKELQIHEAIARKNLDQEMASFQLVKRNTPYGNKEFPWALKKA